MSNPDSSPSAHDTDWFTDAAELHPPSDVVRPDVPDPDRSPPEGAAPAGPSLAGDLAERAAAVKAALGDDEAGLHALDRLTRAGRLSALAAVLQRLASLATTPRDPRIVLEGVEPSLLLSQVVRALDDPLRIQQGEGRGTCGAATLEYMLARRYPAELVRLLDGLTRYGGEIAMRSGATLTLPPTAIARDDSGRVDIDRLFQSAVMSRGTRMSWIFDYDNQQDHDNFLSEIQGNSQMPCSGFRNVWADITGEDLAAKSSFLFGREALANEVAAGLGKGAMIPVLVTWSSPTSYHFLVCERAERGPGGEPRRIDLRNPWGVDDGRGLPVRLPLPGGGGRISMAFSDLASMIVGAVLKA